MSTSRDYSGAISPREHIDAPRGAGFCGARPGVCRHRWHHLTAGWRGPPRRDGTWLSRERRATPAAPPKDQGRVDDHDDHDDNDDNDEPFTTAAMSFDAIPRLDLSWAADPAKKPALLAQLRHALTAVGFLYVVGHGVPERVVADLVAVLPALFALPPPAKDAIALRRSPHFLGYSADGAETTAGRADRREQVEFATELPARPATGAPGAPRCDGLVGPNPWPDPALLPALRPAVTAYLAALTALGERFLRLVAEALALPPDALLPFLSDQHRLKLVRYPGLPEAAAADAEIQGVGPHKDSSGWWTFLLQASPPPVGGLQALNRAGAWVDVPAVPGSFVVNIGQAFEVVTGGRCPATTHRVLASPAERFSVPFFQGVRRDLTKAEAVGALRDHFAQWDASADAAAAAAAAGEPPEGRQIDSPFLRGPYDTWGEAQLRTKVRSHRDVGQRFYADVYDQYVNDDAAVAAS